jgi:tryptophanase
MSSKKDAIVNIGGFSGHARRETLSGSLQRTDPARRLPHLRRPGRRDLEALAVGLLEGLDESYLDYRLKQTAYLGERILDAGIPIIEPPGGHAIYIDAGSLFKHIPQSEFPGQALSAALYLEGGIRSAEIGSVMFAYKDPDSGKMVYPQLELVRLAIPRRVYTQSHMDYVVDILKKIADNRQSYRGYRITYAPELLRHFTARFEPL